MLLFEIPSQADIEQNLKAFIADFLRLYPQRHQAALSYIPTIIVECKNDIDPMLIAVIITMESSWRFQAEGKRGERGLMQLMPKYAREFNLADPLDQIRASIVHYRRSLKMCKGNVKDALNAYGCGECRPHRRFLKHRWYWYNKYRRKYKSD